MNNDKNKSKISTIALVLTLTFASIIATSLPIVNASGIPTYAFVSVAPDPAGTNQEVTIQMWLPSPNPTSAGPTGGRWEGYIVTITKPDGDTDHLGPFRADPAALAYALYTPDQIGIYTINFTFPGQHVTGIGLVPIPIDEYYEASSFTTTLTVQKEPSVISPQTPLPDYYWTRPIDAQNQEWYTISGNWLGLGETIFGERKRDSSGNFNPYTEAPDSAHIVWTKSLDFGGLIGGEFGGTPESSYYTGKTYEPNFTPPVIINGVLYYNPPLPPNEGFYAVDLRTGETLWWQNSTGPVTQVGHPSLPIFGYAGISCGQIFNFKTPNEVGARAYLWYMGPSDASGGNSFYMYDANTGQLILTIENSPIGFIQPPNKVQGPSGEILVYVLDATGNWLAMWNSTKAVGSYMWDPTNPTGSYAEAWTWRPPVGATIDFYEGIQWNVTTPPIPFQAIARLNQDVIIATTGNQVLPQNWQMEIGYDAKTGEQLWIQNRTTPMGATAWGLMGPFRDGIYTEFDKGAMTWTGYNASTGEQVWGPSEAYTRAWGSQTLDSDSAYGILYGQSLDGIHALDLTTGQKMWDFYPDPSGLDYPGMITYPFVGTFMTIADGKVFAAQSNSHGVPLFRGAHLYAIDAFSGDKIWKINGFFLSVMPVADGYLVAFNGYDNQIYSFGKGPTEITVTAPDAGIPLGSSALIRGTIMDISSGSKQDGVVELFPNGLPAIADEDMSEWMEYLYQQQPMPMDATGVKVTLDTIDPNGKFISIGTATSNMDGTYGFQWTPEIEGKYEIIATFEGSDSYYSSYTTTYIGVDPAPTPETPITPEEPAAPLITTELAIILAVVAVAVICILGYWALKKRK